VEVQFVDPEKRLIRAQLLKAEADLGQALACVPGHHHGS
jgi:hypothetical protein